MGVAKARGDAGIQKTLLESNKNPGRNPRVGKGWAVAAQIEASGFGVGDDSVLEYALNDRKRARILSLSKKGWWWSLKPLSCFRESEDPTVNCL